MSTDSVEPWPKETFEEWCHKYRDHAWVPRENPNWGGWYVSVPTLDCFPKDFKDNWPDEGVVQTLCDLHNIEVFGEVK